MPDNNDSNDFFDTVVERVRSSFLKHFYHFWTINLCAVILVSGPFVIGPPDLTVTAGTNLIIRGVAASLMVGSIVCLVVLLIEWRNSSRSDWEE
jgi:hypothetical protein